MPDAGMAIVFGAVGGINKFLPEWDYRTQAIVKAVSACLIQRIGPGQGGQHAGLRDY